MKQKKQTLYHMSDYVRVQKELKGQGARVLLKRIFYVKIKRSPASSGSEDFIELVDSFIHLIGWYFDLSILL